MEIFIYPGLLEQHFQVPGNIRFGVLIVRATAYDCGEMPFHLTPLYDEMRGESKVMYDEVSTRNATGHKYTIAVLVLSKPFSRHIDGDIG